MKVNRLAVILVAMAVIGLSLGDALTGHGIKGNKNLNPIVVGDGSGTGTGTGTGTSTGTGGDDDCPVGQKINGECWKSGECHTETVEYDVAFFETKYVLGIGPVQYWLKTGTATLKTCKIDC